MAEDVDPAKLEIADELIAEGRTVDPRNLPADMAPWHRSVIGFVDTLNLWVGRVAAWFVVPLCLAMVYEVLVRKLGTDLSLWLPELWRIVSGGDSPSLVSPAPTLWAYDVSRMLYGSMFMLGAAYALSRGIHIRADFLYRNWSARTQGIVDLVLYVVLFMTGMVALLYHGTEYAWSAWSRGERAMDTAWMPPLGPVRTAIPVGVFLLILQGFSEILKSWYAATRGRWPA